MLYLIVKYLFNLTKIYLEIFLFFFFSKSEKPRNYSLVDSWQKLNCRETVGWSGVAEWLDDLLLLFRPPLLFFCFFLWLECMHVVCCAACAPGVCTPSLYYGQVALDTYICIRVEKIYFILNLALKDKFIRAREHLLTKGAP